MPEFRWILLLLGSLLIAGIWWWGARRSRQAPGRPELRESAVNPQPAPYPAPPGAGEAPGDDLPDEAVREWGVSPFEPLSIHTSEFEQVPVLEGPMTALVEAAEADLDLRDALHDGKRPDDLPIGSARAPPMQPALPLEQAPAKQPPPWNPPPSAAQAPPARPVPPWKQVPPAAPAPAAAAPARSGIENSDRFAAVMPKVPNASETQRIVTLRVCATGDSPWKGTALIEAFAVQGLALGRYQVYHRKHSDGRTLFCVASLIEPGTFDIAQMPQQEFRGVTLFAVLPGPVEPLQTLDELFAAARGLAESLSGTLQDDKGAPLSAQRALELREEVARFQARLG